MKNLYAIIGVFVLTLLAGTSSAQQSISETPLSLSTAATSSQILVVSAEMLLQQSNYGQRLLQEYAESTARFSEENKTIEETLVEEEKALTEARSSLSLEEFRARADAFDQKVTKIRAERENRARAQQEKEIDLQVKFFNDILPILNEIMRENGAKVIIERRNLFYVLDEVDITQIAINRINAAFPQSAQ